MGSESEKKGKRVAVAMSGGVDSSAAAIILKEKGYDVIGISMKLWEGAGGGRARCCSLEDFQDARRVADSIDIPYYVVNMQEEFSKRVIDNFVSNYVAGRTPNPCVLCNQEMKFDLLMKKAAELGADYLATGHYSKIEFNEARGRYVLRKGADPAKDQSYFLFSMTQEQMKKVLFPLGGMKKDEVRDILRRNGIKIADKEESQDICFVDSENVYSSFIEDRVDSNMLKKGRIVNSAGEVLGKHDGIHRFTIGQRRGLGISAERRLYVTGFDYLNNDVIVGSEDELLSNGLLAGNVNWVSIPEPEGEIEASVKIRYSQDEHSSTVIPAPGGKIIVNFDEAQKAVTPGQALVLYSGDELLGGGWIEESIR